MLFALLRDADPADAKLTALWSELLDLCAAAAADVLTHVRGARTQEYNSDGPCMYQRLLTAWPDEIRRLAEWTLQNQDQLVATFENGPAHNRVRCLIEDLAAVGTADTSRLLNDFVRDPELEPVAVAAIRAIKSRE